MLIMGKVHKYSLPFANMKHHDKIMTKYAKYTCIHTHVYIYIHIHIHPHKCHSIRQRLCLIPYVYAFNTHGKNQHVCIYIHIYEGNFQSVWQQKMWSSNTRAARNIYFTYIFSSIQPLRNCGVQK